MALLVLPQPHKANPSTKSKEPFLATRGKTMTNKKIILRILTISNLIENKQK
jgi:hypothetical protein